MSYYGNMSPHTVGIVMKELARRAIVEIRSQRFAFEVWEKEAKGDRPDFVTSADKAAQVIYLRGLQENLPGYGIVAEEENLRIPCTLSGDRELVFTVDPLDGTKAYKRRQSHNVGTMIALHDGSEVVAAVVGDINTQELYYYRPESTRVHRVSEYNTVETLIIDESNWLSDQYLLLRDVPERYLPGTFDIMANNRFFHGIEVTGGSIGITFARLWKGEVGAIGLQPGANTPWDFNPIFGISRKLGFEFLSLSDDGAVWESSDLGPVSETFKLEHITLVVHKSQIGRLNHWWQEN